MESVNANTNTINPTPTTLQQEIAHFARTRLDHVEAHGCKGLCDTAAYMQQLINDGHRWIEERGAHVPVPTGSFEGVWNKVSEALRKDEYAQCDPIRFALMVYETLSPGEVALLEEYESREPQKAIEWTRQLLKAGGADFEFTA